MDCDCQAVALTGATGPVGRHLLAALAMRPFEVRAISRHPPLRSPSAGRIRWVRAELSAGWPEAADAPCLLSAGPLAELAAGFQRRMPRGLRRLIALSSTSARHKHASVDPEERAAAERLLAAEERLAACCRSVGVRLTILRPTLIYGGGAPPHLAPLLAIARVFRILPLPWPARGLRQPVHAADLATLMLALLEQPLEGIFEIGGGEVLSARELIRRMVRAELRGPCLCLPMPVALLRLLLPRWRGPLSRLAQDQLPRPEPELRALDWQPRGFHWERSEGALPTPP